ncbi:hypothetical protein JZ751_029459 [Albula glossodonta]|uniref:Uncharacterized protein n=1 Tax=Albula glossodonta TaxID=121402 RepID=A0A8T2PA92_9TELE|nr:hypothetical protein JZ751_029459 [Albula glossodonta]
MRRPLEVGRGNALRPDSWDTHATWHLFPSPLGKTHNVALRQDDTCDGDRSPRGYERHGEERLGSSLEIGADHSLMEVILMTGSPGTSGEVGAGLPDRPCFRERSFKKKKIHRTVILALDRNM